MKYCGRNSTLEASWRKEDCGASPKRVLEDSGASLEEDGDLIRECNATQAELFLSGCLREDVEGEAEKVERVSREAKEEEYNSGK